MSGTAEQPAFPRHNKGSTLYTEGEKRRRKRNIFILSPSFYPAVCTFKRSRAGCGNSEEKRKKKEELRSQLCLLRNASTESNSKVGAVEYLETLFGDAPVRPEKQGRLRPAHFNYLRIREHKVFFYFRTFFLKTSSLRR